MADAVTTQTIQDGERRAVMKFTNISDGTGESAVTKVDVSALAKNSRGETCTEVAIHQIWWQCVGMGVEILFDATVDTPAIILSENSNGHPDYSSFTAIPNNSATGKTGDIKFTTVNAATGDAYTVIMDLIKSY